VEDMMAVEELLSVVLGFPLWAKCVQAHCGWNHHFSEKSIIV
jgi:hypothetical protein